MAESSSLDLQSLQKLFKKGWDAQKRIERGDDDLNSTSDEYKVCVQGGIDHLEQATRLANQLSLFSTNEGLDDLATADVKYLLLPALLGDLTLQISEGDRLETIQKARVYFVDYLQRCRSYSITSEDPPPARNPDPSASSAPTPRSYQHLAAERTARIARLTEQKEIERKLKELTVRVELSLVSQEHQVDEGVMRDQAFTLLRVWVFRCQDHIRSIDQEVEILESMKNRGVGKGSEATPTAPPPVIKPVKPIVITKEMLQSKVFGAGYPSLPTMSVEEFYQQKYKEEMEQRKAADAEAALLQTRVDDDSMVGGARGRKEQEEVEEMEADDEEESEETLKKEREWDDFKDDNRRGWGNKKNMG